jgi:hypothetical protein
MKKSGWLLALVPVFLVSAPVRAEEVESIYFRVKAGPQYFSGLSPVSSAIGVGLDLGYRTAGGFGVHGMARLGFNGETDTSSAVTSYPIDRAKTRFLGVAPGFAVTKDSTRLSFALGAGAYTVSNEQTISTGSSTAIVGPFTTTRFGLAPTIDIDFALGSSVGFTLGISYVTSVGSKPHFSEFTPMAGLAFQL